MPRWWDRLGVILNRAFYPFARLLALAAQALAQRVARKEIFRCLANVTCETPTGDVLIVACLEALEVAAGCAVLQGYSMVGATGIEPVTSWV